MSQSPSRRSSSPAGAGAGERPTVGGPLGERLDRLAERFGAPDDDAADLLARATAEAWAEVQAGLHAPSVATVPPPRRDTAGDVRERRVPVPEAVMALGWSHVWAWVCFSALTRSRGATVSAADVAEHAGWSPGHTRRLLAGIAALGSDFVKREGRRWAPGCMWRDISGYRDEHGQWHRGRHGRFQHHSIAELAGADRAARRALIVLAAARLWCRQRRGGQPVPVYRRTLARWFGTSRRSIDRALRYLADAGRLAVEGSPAGMALAVIDTT